jgi:predicted  nucleic acid-binding Zn-ribbon protein
MSKSVEAKLTEAEAEKVALETKVAKLAGENDTYTSRMKEMEDSIAKAMERMKCMEEKMGEYSKMKATLDSKMEETKAELATMDEDEDDAGGEDTDPMEKDAENSIQGVNEKVIAGVKKKQGKKAKKAEAIAEVAPTAEAVAVEKVAEVAPATEKVAEAPVVEKVAEVVAPAPVAEEPKIETVAKDVVPTIDLNALVEAKVAEMTSKFAKTDSKFNELDAELAKAKETLALEAKVKAEAMATVKSLTEKYEALLSKVSGIESNSKTVEEKVAKQVASLGVEPISSTPLETEVATKTPQDILKEWEGITDSKMARQFYLRHSAEIAEATFPKRK